LMARLTFEKGRTQVEACPYDIMGHIPRPFSGSAKVLREAAFKRHLEQLSITVGRSRISAVSGDGCFALEPPK
jgi:hypothetical protein